jgi:hypothetical protein
MTSFRLGHKIYFFAVGFLALWVGFFGFFLPTHVDWALPWLVPPLHARFLGSMYLSGATFMVLSLLASRWDEVRVVLPMIAIWTGMLFIISLFYLSEFNFAKPQPWIWFGAYLVYPLVALWLAWQYRDADRTPMGARLFVSAGNCRNSFRFDPSICARFHGICLALEDHATACTVIFSTLPIVRYWQSPARSLSDLDRGPHRCHIYSGLCSRGFDRFRYP